MIGVRVVILFVDDVVCDFFVFEKLCECEFVWVGVNYGNMWGRYWECDGIEYRMGYLKVVVYYYFYIWIFFGFWCW